MSEPGRLSLDLTWRTILRVLVTAALVWAWLRLTWLVLVVLIAVVLAVTLEPAVRWLTERRWPRWLAATILMVVLTGTVIGFLYITSSELNDQARLLGDRMQTAANEPSPPCRRPGLNGCRRRTRHSRCGYWATPAWPCSGAASAQWRFWRLQQSSRCIS